MKEPTLARREREKQQQRQEILQAALELFSAKGYHNVTMLEIAEASEFAVGTLYKFFRNKEDLYRNLVTENTTAFFDKIRAAMDEPTDEIEKLRGFVRAKGEIPRSNMPLMRVLFSETHGESFDAEAGLGAEIRRQGYALREHLAQVFASGIARGLFKPIAEPEYLAVALDGVTIALFFRWFEAPELKPYPEDPDMILNMFFQGLLNR